MSEQPKSLSAAPLITRLIYGIIAAFIAAMATMVFANVIMRYFFHSGWTTVEEIARFLFIWLTFLGSIVAFAENAHLGIDTLVQKLKGNSRKRLFVFNHLIMLATMGLVLDGTIRLTLLNMDQSSPSLGLPYAYVYVSGVVMSVGLILILLRNIYRALVGSLTADEMVITAESEDRIDEIVKTKRESTMPEVRP